MSSSQDDVEELSFLRLFEFIIIARIFFILTFVTQVIFNPRMQYEIKTIFRVDGSFYVSAILSEILVQIGFFVAVFGYTCFYNVSLVHAAEMSLI